VLGRHDTGEFELDHAGERYVFRREGDQLKVGLRQAGSIGWLDSGVPLSQLGGEARQAIDNGDITCPALLIALKGIAAAAATRGG
jgi:hypothetical protein